MSTLHVFIGSHGSDRNKRAKDFAEKMNIPLLQADEVRKELADIPNHLLFEELYRRIKQTLQKETMVFDATNLIAKQRKNLLMRMKEHDVHGHCILNTIETCIEKDKELERSLGADFVISRFLSTDIPFMTEGWKELNYVVEPPAKDYTEAKNKSLFEDEHLQWAGAFMKTGKPYLDALPANTSKKIGYNNISAYIAFQTLYNQNASISYIQDVVNLILYKKRWTSANEKGKEKFKKELRVDVYDKLLLLF